MISGVIAAKRNMCQFVGTWVGNLTFWRFQKTLGRCAVSSRHSLMRAKALQLKSINCNVFPKTPKRIIASAPDIAICESRSMRENISGLIDRNEK